MHPSGHELCLAASVAAASGEPYGSCATRGDNVPASHLDERPDLNGVLPSAPSVAAALKEESVAASAPSMAAAALMVLAGTGLHSCLTGTGLPSCLTGTCDRAASMSASFICSRHLVRIRTDGITSTGGTSGADDEGAGPGARWPVQLAGTLNGGFGFDILWSVVLDGTIV